jgi:hypothetical protein
VIDVLTGLGMGCAAPFIQKRPERIVFSVLVGWVTAQILVALISPPIFIKALLGRLILAIGLTRGLAAARGAETLCRQLIESASGP